VFRKGRSTQLKPLEGSSSNPQQLLERKKEKKKPILSIQLEKRGQRKAFDIAIVRGEGWSSRMWVINSPGRKKGKGEKLHLFRQHNLQRDRGKPGSHSRGKTVGAPGSGTKCRERQKARYFASRNRLRKKEIKDRHLSLN